MFPRPKLFSTLLFLIAASTAFSQMAIPSRISQAIDGGEMTTLQGNLPPWAKADNDQGSVSPNLEIPGLSLVFNLSANQQAALDQLLIEQQDPSSPNYHRWLTPEQYAARFGMSQSDVDRVVTWLQSQGFTEISVARSRTQVSFSGTAARIEATFHTEIHNYLVDGEIHYANATEPSVPAAFAGAVLGFRHLDSFSPKPRSRQLVSPEFTSGMGAHFLAPADFATIYDITPLYNQGFDGTGVTIAVVGQTAISLSDANMFRSLSGLSVNPPQLLPVPNTGATATTPLCTQDITEAMLDVEWSGGVAKNANVLYVYVGAGTGACGTTRTENAFDALQYAVDNDLAPVISISYGSCEAANLQSVALEVRGWAKQANSQGQTISAASGDDGAADCESSAATTATHGLAVDVPASIPEVTGVGGTEFMGDNTAGADAPYWGGANSSGGGSALIYIPEMAWNDSPITGTGPSPSGSLSSGGGGVSTFFAKPSFQTALTPADGHRDVPDVSLSASANHDGYLVCSQGVCSSGFKAGPGGVFGGTSVSAQVFAGILAILNQATKSAGLSNVNTELYTLAASTPAAFHDITTGNNIVPCKQGSTNCPASTPFQIGYSAVTGYDRATGLGSVDVNNLASAWMGFSTTPIATTTVVTSSSLTVASRTNVTFTATVTPASSSSLALTGTVQFMIDGSAAGSAVTLSSGTATFSTSSLAVGTHSVIGVYSGAGPNYATSTSAAITETITGGFTISGTPVTITTPGSPGTSTITVSPVSGFTGTVNLTCTPPAASAEITCSLSPTSVTITGAGSATTTLTVSTTAAHASSRTSAAAGRHGKPGWLVASTGALFAGIFMIGAPRRHRRWMVVLGMSFCVFLAVGVGCGGGSSGGGGGTVTPTAATPTFSPAPGAVTSGTTVTLSDTTSGAVIHCTTDGSVPTASSPACTTEMLTSTTTINAIAVASGFNNSAVASGTYTIPDPGTVAGAYNVTVTGSGSGLTQNATVTVTVQ